ncbi:MAG TPA: cyanophycin synthetase [Aggregatilineales bacterium]|nr:cyanophycin synthetase [Anaerolineales bacterium]HRE48842.1 cyanophycin synthetase [Aggregatilineales bacterium]
MKILNKKVYRGPNLYEYRPVVRLDLDIEDLEDYPTTKIPGFIDNLLATMPTLEEHGCSYGVPGGFVRRMRETTWIGHVIEHIAIELQCLAGSPVSRGKTRSLNTPGHYMVIYEFAEEEVGLAAGELAVDLVRWLIPPTIPSGMSETERIWFNYLGKFEAFVELAKEKALGPSTLSLVQAAERRGVPWIRLNEHSLIQFGQGRYQKRIEATVTSRTGHIAVGIAQDKALTSRMLRDAGLPVPRQTLVADETEAISAAEDIGYPVVTKPYDGNHGRGVSINLRSPEDVRIGYQLAAEESSRVVIEQYVTGRDYRILVVGGKVVAAAERVPGHVVGDGTHTIRELVDRVNQDPRRGIGHEKILTRLEIDDQAVRLLALTGYTLETILAIDEVFFLRQTGNLSTGGTAIDRTDDIHYENIQMAERAIQVIGLDIGGVDFISPDISRPYTEVGGGIVEVNAGPGFRMHVAPSEGKPRDVAGAVIDMLFPPGTPARIPLCAITGTNGKTTTTRMVGHIMKLAGMNPGMTTTDGIYVNGEAILRGDMTGPWSARVVLREPNVDCAVLETARGGIVREGLGFDRCHVGAVLNVQGDHLGLGGIETLEQLADMKQVVIESVADDGWGVLNADDPMTRGMGRYCDGNVCWFTLDSKNDLVRDHVRGGGRAISLEQGINGEMLTLYDEGKHIPLLWAHLIPATFEGRARFNIANAMAAAAVAYCMGVNVEMIRLGLKTFTTTFYQTPGRMNIFEEYPFKVIFDYAHNPAAMRAVAEFVQSLRITGRKIGVIAAPGDRRDGDIKEVGYAAAAAYDYLIIKEDWNTRGRQAGSIAGLLREAVVEKGFDPERIQIVLNEFDAIRTALDMAESGDIVVVFGDDVSGAWKLITKYREPEVYRRWLVETKQPLPPEGTPVGWRGVVMG